MTQSAARRIREASASAHARLDTVEANVRRILEAVLLDLAGALAPSAIDGGIRALQDAAWQTMALRCAIAGVALPVEREIAILDEAIVRARSAWFANLTADARSA